MADATQYMGATFNQRYVIVTLQRLSQKGTVWGLKTNKREFPKLIKRTRLGTPTRSFLQIDEAIPWES